MEFVFIVGRVLFGGYFIMSGLNHFMKSEMMVGFAKSRGLPSPKVGNLVGGLFMLLGGLGMLLGVQIELSVLLLVVFLLSANLGIHHFWSDTDPKAKMEHKMHFMTNMGLIGASLMMLAIESPWILSLF